MDKHLNITITPGTILRAILLVLLVGVLFYLKNLVLIVLTSIVVASSIEPGANWFMRFRIPRVFAVLLIYIIIFAMVFGVFYLFVPAVLGDVLNFLTFVPQLLESFDLADVIPTQTIEQTQAVAQSFSIPDSIKGIQDSLSSLSSGFIQTVTGFFGGIVSLILIIVFSFYFAVQKTGIDDFLRVITPVEHQDYVVNLWRRSQAKIGRWMQGQIILALIVAVFVYLGLTILGVKYALALAVLSAIAELIPIFGPIIAAIPGIAIAGVSGGPTLALLTLGLYVIVQQFESHLIYPLVVRKVVGVPPLLVILALLIGAQLAGFLGVLLSVPIAAALQEFVNDIRKKKDHDHDVLLAHRHKSS